MQNQQMPQDTARPGPPGGKRSCKAAVEQRIDIVEAMLLKQIRRAEIVARMQQQFGVSPRATDAYISRVRERRSEAARPQLEEKRCAALSRLHALSESAEERGAFSAAVGAERLRADILGLQQPRKHRIDATVWNDLSARELARALPVLVKLAQQGRLEVTESLRSDVRKLASAVGASGIVVYLPEVTDEDSLATNRGIASHADPAAK